MIVLLRSLMLAAALAATPALAGGDDYDALADVAGKGPAYFGFVRDTRGAPVAGARVVLSPKGGEPLALKSNVLGLYRSHISKEVQPDDVEVSCEKEGYRQASVLRRNQMGAKDMHIETNCTLQKL